MRRIELLSHLKQNEKCYIGCFSENSHSLEFVEKLYICGATQVFVVEGMGQNGYFDTIFIHIDTTANPELIVAIFNSRADECDLCPDYMNCLRLWWD